MAKKISELTALTAPASDDLLAIVDDSASETKKMTLTTLFGSTAAPIRFTGLGTATKAIDFSSSGLSVSDKCIYINSTNYWQADGDMLISGHFSLLEGEFFSLANANFPIIQLEDADTDAKAVTMALKDGNASYVPVFVIGDEGLFNTDLGWFNGVTGPRIALVDADEDSYVTFGDNKNALHYYNLA